MCIVEQEFADDACQFVKRMTAFCLEFDEGEQQVIDHGGPNLRHNGIFRGAEEGFDFKILKDKTQNVTPPEHLTYFNPHSLSLILSKTGFQTVLVETPGKLDVEIILKEKKAGYPLKQNNEYLDYLLNQGEEVLADFQKFLSANKLSSHMLIVARKK